MIESKDNKLFKKICSLKTKKFRDKYNQFIIEGEKFVTEIPNDYNIDCIIVSESYILKKDSFINKQVFVMKDSLFKNISDTISPQGIMAIVNKKQFVLDDLLTNGCFLIIENMQDPGNLGTLIRTADASSIDCVLLSTNTVDLYNSKTIRASAGSIFNVPIITDVDIRQAINKLKQFDIKILVAHLKGNKNIYDINLTKNIAIIIGNEGNGISDETSFLADELVKIPIIGKAESLNASIAGTIIMYEVVRQKLI